MHLAFLKRTLLSLALFSISCHMQAQGCSDAGVCSVSDYQSGLDKPTKAYLKFGYNMGLADNDINVIGVYAEYGRSVSDRLSMNAKLTGISQSGNDIRSTGLSDIFLNSRYKVGESFNVMLGLKIPLSDGNKLLEGLALPMDYQSSLGTLDLLAGLSDSLGRFNWVLAYQQPLTQNNNQFFSALYPMDSPLRSIQTTNGFDRAGDVMGRLSYPMELNERWDLTASALGIYHLRNDRFTNLEGRSQDIANSAGLTLNINLFLNYALNNTSNLKLSMAAPAVVREARPDGLTRGFIINLEYRVRF